LVIPASTLPAKPKLDNAKNSSKLTSKHLARQPVGILLIFTLFLALIPYFFSQVQVKAL